MTRVGVVGAAGRMGATVCDAVAAADGLELVAAIDVVGGGGSVHGVPVHGELKALADAGAEVVVDFTVATAARQTLPWLALHGMHAVVGTTGFTDDDIASFRSAFTGSNCLVAANFAIGAVLMMKFAEQAAPYFETAEIIEFHHNAKADAPSGTAMATAQRMAAASDEWAADPTRHEVIPGARGGVGPGGIHVHGVRMVGMTASQEVILGTSGQTLVIRHDSNDRVSFMPGVVLACRRVAGLPDRFTTGIDSLL
ncbi:MAG: 4-hydroxy-tetrahydrodipicolinate reductase [Actinobacteria bacterium]|nr:4-hydroxy-tetrahydrodipicolinate reductase [Actinomycetota bacterium]NBR66514.1 4-hydroxy-tetrahydrodipicolinate reductase [Actinomycetota bacterium]